MSNMANGANERSRQISYGMVLLGRAEARAYLVRNGQMTVDEAIDGLIPAFQNILLGRDILGRMERLYPYIPPKRKFKRAS